MLGSIYRFLEIFEVVLRSQGLAKQGLGDVFGIGGAPEGRLGSAKCRLGQLG